MKFLFTIITGFSEKLGLQIQLKTDQKVAVSCLWDDLDVLAILSTGFGMSLILKSLVMANKWQAMIMQQLWFTVYTSEQHKRYEWQMAQNFCCFFDQIEVELKSADFQLLFSLRAEGFRFQ